MFMEGGVVLGLLKWRELRSVRYGGLRVVFAFFGGDRGLAISRYGLTFREVGLLTDAKSLFLTMFFSSGGLFKVPELELGLVDSLLLIQAGEFVDDGNFDIGAAGLLSFGSDLGLATDCFALVI